MDCAGHSSPFSPKTIWGSATQFGGDCCKGWLRNSYEGKWSSWQIPEREHSAGIHLALEVLEEMECLNKSLHKRTITVAGMQAAVDYVKTALQQNTFFLFFYLDAVKICLELVHMALMGLSWPLTSPIGVKLSTFHTFNMPPRQALSNMGRPGTYARAHTQSLWAFGICCGVKAERHREWAREEDFTFQRGHTQLLLSSWLCSCDALEQIQASLMQTVQQGLRYTTLDEHEHTIKTQVLMEMAFVRYRYFGYMWFDCIKHGILKRKKRKENTTDWLMYCLAHWVMRVTDFLK